jgi:hypothetical protein
MCRAIDECHQIDEVASIMETYFAKCAETKAIPTMKELKSTVRSSQWLIKGHPLGKLTSWENETIN